MENFIHLLEAHHDKVHQFTVEALVMGLLITVLYVILLRNLFRPLGDILRKRELRRTRAETGAEESLRAVEAKTKEREDALRRAAQEAVAFLNMGREHADRQRADMLAQARKHHETLRRKAEAALALSREQGKTILERESHGMAQLVVTRLLDKGPLPS